ncbi:MAG TPA: SDR family oxidoreductase [Mycobacteriales bacterium]|nr:SDR family oxidoreductase [Mycobacteriales bacterium]
MDARTFVVVGGTSGLGREIVRRLVPDHQVVVIGDIEEEVAATAAELGCDGMVCDVSHYERVQHTLKEIVSRYGTIHGLAHCAAMWAGGSLQDFPHEVIRRVVEVNVLGAAYVLKEAVTRMLEQGGGNIVYIGAMAVQVPRPGIPLYRATKNFGSSLVESLAQAHGSNGIKIMQLHPGPMPTRLQERVGAKFLDDVYALPEQVAREVIRLLALGPDDLYVSGQQVLRADGRW